MSPFSPRPLLALAGLTAALAPAAFAAPQDGSSAASAGLSAAQILRDYSSSASGVYWIDADGAGGDVLFATGDLASWGVLASADAYQAVSGDNFEPNATVKASFGTAVAAGGLTNVLNRNGTGSGLLEDPWVGFEGNHIANIGKMMYGEAGYGGPHINHKNAHLGVNVFVRELNPPALPVPEPDTAGLALAGGAVLAALLRRRRAQD